MACVVSVAQALSTVGVKDDAQVVIKDGVPCFYAPNLTNIKEVNVLRLADPKLVVNGRVSSWSANTSIDNNLAGSSRERCLKYAEPQNFNQKTLVPFQQGVGYLVYLYDARHETYQDEFWHVASFCLIQNPTGLFLTKAGENGACTAEPLNDEDKPSMWQWLKDFLRFNW
jgi:hypothetical protein